MAAACARWASGNVWIPAESDGTMWIHFTPHDGARFVSAASVLGGEVLPERLERKLVLVGVTALGLGDQHVTPLGERLPGIEVHAQALENIFDGRVLVRPRWAEWAEAGALLAAGALVVFLTPTVGMLRAALLALGLGAGLLGGSFLAYRHLAHVFDGLTPALGLGMVYTATLGGALAEADRQRRALRQRLQEEREAAARLAGELEAARRIQLGLLPRPESAFPGEGRFRIAAVMEPARVVGGDLFDFFLLDGDRLLFLVGDVSGKGLPASLFMAATKAFYRSISTRHATELARTMREANTEMGRDNPEAFFVTLVAAVLDVNTGRLWYCNAGHETPWIVRPETGTVERLGGRRRPAALRARRLRLRDRRGAAPARRHRADGDGRRHRGAGSRGQPVRHRAGDRPRDRGRAGAPPQRARPTGRRSGGGRPDLPGALRAGRRRDAARRPVARPAGSDRARETPGSAHRDLDPPVARLGYPVGCRHPRLALAASDGADAVRRDASGDQEGPDALGAAEREGIVVLVRADGVGVASHRELGRGPRGDRQRGSAPREPVIRA